MSFMKNLFGKKGEEEVEHKAMEINSKNFEEEVLKSDQPVLIDFWAPWCSPCRMLAPTIEDVAGEYEGKAKVGKINTDDNQQLASQFGIRGIPTMMFFKDGKEVNRLVGVRQKEEIKNILDSLL